MQRFIHAQVGGAVCVAAFCALIGCSGDSSPSAGAAGVIDIASVRACELLMPEDVEAATGLAVEPGRNIGFEGSAPMCSWSRTGSEVDIVVTLIVTPGRYRTYEEFLASASDSAFGDVLDDTEVDAIEVDGLDFFGVWMPDAGTLQWFGDGFMVQVGTETAAGRDKVEASTSLARAAAARLR